MNKKYYELALAQITGYAHGKDQDLIGMVTTRRMENKKGWVGLSGAYESHDPEPLSHRGCQCAVGGYETAVDVPK